MSATNKATHLGIERISTGNNRKELVQTRIATARRTVFDLMGAVLHGLNGVNPKVAIHLIQIYVMSRLLYGLEITTLRDRPFNLKGRVMVFCFVQNLLFRQHQHKTQNIYFCRAKHNFFFQNLTLGYMTKTSESDYFFFLHQNQNIFFSNLGNQNIFLEKNHNPPPPSS